MSGGIHRQLYVEGDSPVHRLPAHCKLVATFAFVFVMVATPRDAFWAFGAYAAMLGTIALIARIPPTTLARRLFFELPFVVFAFLLPFVGTDPHTEVAGLSLSVPGLWGAWGIIVKGTLGVGAAAILVATTDVRALLGGLDRLRVPRELTAIASFMIRYGEVVAEQLRAMKIARVSRGHDPHWIWQARAVAATAGTLFIRTYERGERVYLAMASRGYGSPTPRDDGHAAARREWLTALALPFAAMIAVVLAA